MNNRLDGIKWSPHARIEKYSPEVVEELTRILGYEPTSHDFARFSADPESVTEVDGNILVSTGISNITNLIIGGGGQALTNARSICGVGATATAEVIGNTALGSDGASAYYQGFDATYPTRTTVTATNDTLNVVATFASGNANFAWNEWCWATSTAGTITPGATLTSVATGTQLVNRKTASMGTKASGASWVFTTTVKIS